MIKNDTDKDPISNNLFSLTPNRELYKGEIIQELEHFRVFRLSYSLFEWLWCKHYSWLASLENHYQYYRYKIKWLFYVLKTWLYFFTNISDSFFPPEKKIQELHGCRHFAKKNSVKWLGTALVKMSWGSVKLRCKSKGTMCFRAYYT